MDVEVRTLIGCHTFPEHSHVVRTVPFNAYCMAYHIKRALEEAKPHEALILLWIRVRLQVRAFLDAIQHRD